MHSLLPNAKELRVNQQLARVTAKDFNALDQLLVIIPKRPKKSLWKLLPEGPKLQAVLKRHDRDAAPFAVSRLNNDRQTLVVIAETSTTASAFERLTLARKMVAAALNDKAGAMGVFVRGFVGRVERPIAEATIAAAHAAAFRLPSYKSEKAKAPRIKSLRVLGLGSEVNIPRLRAEAAGNNLARWLTTQPPNKLDGVQYAKAIKLLAADEGWQRKRFSTRALKALGAGAFLAVAQGNEDDSASIIRLRYRPKGSSSRAAVSLVGKGIIFDTGGTNLKPFNSMLDMHGDMQGSAVALGTLKALSDLKVPFAVDCWLAITENRTGPEAYKSQDVITAANGKTIQTIHTDAEGRMALADTLVLASKEKPGVIIDYATLTGTCISALTSRYSGVFSNRPDWQPVLRKTGVETGERVWPFPVSKEFLEDLKSPVADLMQCSPKNDGDHLLAAAFLNEFVENETPWIHLDLSAGRRSGGLAHIPSDTTGFGVRYTLGLLLDEGLHESEHAA